jgi:medium-chain acyl-[acyl-carrier-protein] hydrolase
MNSTKNQNPWLVLPRPNPQAKLRLFCFAYSGGGASIFRQWYQQLNPQVEIYGVQLPGRETRLMETPFNRLTPLINALVQAILPSLNQPFAFFGHSLGGLVCFELARYLRLVYRLNPLHLFVSGASAPHVRDTDPPIHNLPQLEFIEELRRLNGTPEEVLASPELLELILPTLRADFAVSETYTYTKSAPLSCSITAFGGEEDTEVSQEKLAAWQELTTGEFSMEILPGNHFFIHSHRQELLSLLSKYMAGYI